MDGVSDRCNADRLCQESSIKMFPLCAKRGIHNDSIEPSMNCIQIACHPVDSDIRGFCVFVGDCDRCRIYVDSSDPLCAQKGRSYRKSTSACSEIQDILSLDVSVDKSRQIQDVGCKTRRNCVLLQPDAGGGLRMRPFQ